MLLRFFRVIITNRTEPGVFKTDISYASILIDNRYFISAPANPERQASFFGNFFVNVIMPESDGA